MDEKKIWKRLTDWQRSPVYRYLLNLVVKWHLGKLNHKDAFDADWMFGKIGEPAVPALIGALKDENSEARHYAALVLGRIGDASAVPALIGALKDEVYNVRSRAAKALVNIRDLSAVPAFVEVFVEAMEYDNPRDPLWRRWEFESLGKLMSKCETIEDFEEFEKGIEEGSVALRKKRVDRTILAKAQIYLAAFTRRIARKKDELSLKKDLLLTDKPKPPKKGSGVYRTLRMNVLR